MTLYRGTRATATNLDNLSMAELQCRHGAYDSPARWTAYGTTTIFGLFRNRPCIATTVEFLYRNSSHPREASWLGVKRVLRYIRETMNFCKFL